MSPDQATGKETLLELLGATAGLVCCVGAGGKKSTLYRLAEAHPGRVALTATAHIERFPKRHAARSVVAEADSLEAAVVRLARHERQVFFAKPCALPGRLEGVDFEQLARLRRQCGFDLCLVKADGARNRILKAPAAHEPAIPPGATTVLPVCSIRAVGLPLDEQICHRPERFAAVTGLAPGKPVQTVHLARLLASPEGALKSVREAEVVPIINMADDDELEDLAMEVAEQALALTVRFERIVIASMRDDLRPIRRVVSRRTGEPSPRPAAADPDL